MRQRPATSLAGNLIDASEKLIEFNVVDVNVIAVLELLEGVSAALHLPSSWAGRVVPERLDVVVFESQGPHRRFEQRNFFVGMPVRAARERRDRDHLLAGDLFLVNLAMAFDDCREIVATALVVVSGPAMVVFAVTPFTRNPDDLARHAVGFNDAC